MKTAPWHSSKTMDVDHDDTDCNSGNNIEDEYRRDGTGNLPLCASAAASPDLPPAIRIAQ